MTVAWRPCQYLWMDTAHNERGAWPLHAPASSPGPFEQFYARVLADLPLQETLRQPTDTGDFIALAVQTAREFGFAIGAGDVKAAMRSNVPRGADLIDSAVRATPVPPKGWLPVRASWHDGRLYVHWSYFGDRPLREPFFEGDVQRALFKPFNQLFRYTTPIAELGAWLQEHPGLRPDGFIFHMSRCGSTLVSQMLAAPSANIVISEAEPIDAIVRARQARPDLSEGEQALWLRWMIGALGQPRGGGARHYFIKLDCWHTLALPLFRRAFPDVPWTFLYRDPVEVLVSQMTLPGMQMVPGTLDIGLLGLKSADLVRSREDYCARVLAAVCEPVLRKTNDKALLINYSDLPQAAWSAILPHFGIKSGESDHAVMQEAAKYDAKMPSFSFTPDSDTKQRTATAAIRMAAGARLGEIYRQLETVRLGA
jgi:hypothetical protein